MAKRPNLDQYKSKGRRVVELSTGRIVHEAPTKKAAFAVAHRMHGVAVQST